MQPPGSTIKIHFVSPTYEVILRKNIIFFGIVIGVPIALKLIIDLLGGDSWETSSLHHWLIPVANVFLDVFKTPAVAVILSGIILFLALIFMITFIFYKAGRVTRALVAARQAIEEPKRRNASICEHIEVAFSDNIILKRAFRDALQHNGNNLNYSVISDFDAQLNLGDFDRTGLSFDFYRELPDYFVGSGLVFTFCGLVAGLYFASQGLMTADISLARDSLNKLLSASTFKFLTSIAGVGSSLIMSIAFRIGIDRMERAKRELILSIENQYSNTADI